MIYDPTSTIVESHEARVRVRGVRLSPNSNATSQVSTRSDFIAPDYAAPSTIELELEKGLAGWSEGTAPEDVSPKFTDWAKRDLAAIAISGTTVVRKAPAAPMVKLNRTGPRRNRGAK